jgi:hypothetical protein
MSSGSEQDRVRELAERVARRLSEAPRVQSGAEAPGGGDDIASLRASLAELQRRLAHVESHLAHGEEGGGRANDPGPRRDSSPTQVNSLAAQTPSRSTWLSGTYVPATAAHPSQEQFEGLGEAVSELVEYFEREKTCTVEPGGKPCDHCGMCSARGF